MTDGERTEEEQELIDELKAIELKKQIRTMCMLDNYCKQGVERSKKRGGYR